MKRKLLCILSLAAIASTQAFALQIVNGKLLGEKETGSNSIKVIHKEVKSDQTLLRFKNKVKQNDGTWSNYIQASEKMDNFLTPVITTSSPLNFIGKSDYFILNQGTTYQTYTINHSICMMEKMGAPDSISCNNHSSTIYLQPGGYAYENGENSVYHTFNKAGTYSVDMGITIMNSDQSTLYSTDDYQQVEVNDGNVIIPTPDPMPEPTPPAK